MPRHTFQKRLGTGWLPKSWTFSARGAACMLGLLLSLSGCGGGGGGGAAAPAEVPVAAGAGTGGATTGGTSPSDGGALAGAGGSVSTPPPATPSTDANAALLNKRPTKAEASRLLAQATFGPSPAEIDRLANMTQGQWLAEQFAMSRERSHKSVLDAFIAKRDQAKLMGAQPVGTGTGAFLTSFWRQASTGRDQLRQRVAFALSELFVVSMNDADVAVQQRGYAYYLDLLGDHAFGNYRELLEAVTLNPIMGLYLSALGNQKEGDTVTPDENFAREVMQLFSIGLYELNIDGTLKLGANGRPVETYDNSDITGLAKVLTGFSWYHASRTDAAAFFGKVKDPDYDWRPMKAYPQYHSTSEKKFLGVTLPASSSPDAYADLKTALDTIFNHPNVGPFIGRQLIQRLVTSNPSPAYVGRVAKAFNDNGKGVRGDMKAVLTAVLMDAEARDPALAATPSFGKIREPILRLTHWMRAFNAKALNADGSEDPEFSQMTPFTDNDLGQTPLRAPSVFNFFSPGYIAPNSATGRAGLYAPELDITNTVTVASYINAMQAWVGNGRNSVKSAYTAEVGMARAPDQLIDRLNLLLMHGQMTDAFKAKLSRLIESVRLPTSDDEAIRTALLNRVQLAVFATIVSPQYIVQK